MIKFTNPRLANKDIPSVLGVLKFNSDGVAIVPKSDSPKLDETAKFMHCEITEEEVLEELSPEEQLLRLPIRKLKEKVRAKGVAIPPKATKEILISLL